MRTGPARRGIRLIHIPETRRRRPGRWRIVPPLLVLSALPFLLSCEQGIPTTRTPEGREALGRLLQQRTRVLSRTTRKHVLQALIEGEKAHGIHPLLALAVIEQESTYRVRAKGPKGARGLMQVRPTTGRAVAKRIDIPWQGAEMLYDPAINIRIGTAYLAEMKQKFGAWHPALTAYNLGPHKFGRMKARGRSSASAYSRQVLKRQEDLHLAFREQLRRTAPG